MLKHLYLIFIATFILGFLSGVVIYLGGNTGKEGDGAIPDAPKGFVVTATRFGGNRGLISSSYRITENGSYTYIERKEGSAETKYTGTLPKQGLDLLRAKVIEVNYEEVQGSTFVGVCPITTGGYAYRYTIMYEGVEYAFDSCKQVTASNSFFELLNTYFNQLQEIHSKDKFSVDPHPEGMGHSRKITVVSVLAEERPPGALSVSECRSATPPRCDDSSSA